ncbi:MAG: beta-lactamase family protein [Scytonematopsis contorta HA4267-MV1]|jgi:CubicO group peptidase (beta-lactamase class C family)|nr:beta-lactamase family protein [Scytonematopsis contorta HA4267-MV1]
MNREKQSTSQNTTTAIKDTNLISMVSLLACASMVSVVFLSSYARYLTRNFPPAAKMKPLGEYLSKYMSPIVWQPGELYSYSNHSIALLGYLV